MIYFIYLLGSIVKVNCLDYYDFYLINYSLFVGYGDHTVYSIKNVGSFSKLNFQYQKKEESFAV